jgi:hypothetical protein
MMIIGKAVNAGDNALDRINSAAVQGVNRSTPSSPSCRLRTGQHLMIGTS